MNVHRDWAWLKSGVAQACTAQRCTRPECRKRRKERLRKAWAERNARHGVLTLAKIDEALALVPHESPPVVIQDDRWRAEVEATWQRLVTREKAKLSAIFHETYGTNMVMRYPAITTVRPLEEPS